MLNTIPGTMGNPYRVLLIPGALPLCLGALDQHKVRNKNIVAYARPKYSGTVKKSNEEIALEVINGEWGTGVVRRQRLTQAGYDYTMVQKIVNQILAR